MRTDDEEFFEIITVPEKFQEVLDGLKGFVEIESSEITMLPNTNIKLEGADAAKMLKLMEALENNEDVQAVFSNFDIASKEMRNIE